MTILYYDEGSHGAGFVGYRVTKHIEGEVHSRQKYFSIKEYGIDQAHIQAKVLNTQWEEEAREAILSKRASTSRLKESEGIRELNKIAAMAELANENNIRSTKQLSTFLACATQEGNCLYDIFGIPTNTPEYKALYGTVLQLMKGSPSRGSNGANLLTWGEPVYGKEKAVSLTLTGFKLYCKFKVLLKLKQDY